MSPLRSYMADEIERIENDWIDEQITLMKRDSGRLDQTGGGSPCRLYLRSPLRCITNYVVIWP